MRAAGALSLQNGVWVLPHTKDLERLVEEILSYLHEQGANGQSFSATTLNGDVEKDLVQRFQGLRDEEYTELIERCEGLLAELAKEPKKKSLRLLNSKKTKMGFRSWAAGWSEIKPVK
jgi:hypothetical protein